MMAIFAGVVLAILALFCLVATIKSGTNQQGFVFPFVVTLCVAVLAFCHFLFGIRTRAGAMWAVWAGLLIALFELNEIGRYFLNHGFDKFATVVNLPLTLIIGIQLVSYLLALQAIYGGRQSQGAGTEPPTAAV
jgi:hypothetical protein